MLKINFQMIQFKDLELLREWRNSPRISKNMYNREYITKEKQENWFRGLEEDNTRRYFVCSIDNIPVGSLYFNSIQNESCEWGCYIGGDGVIPGVGLVLGASALNYAFDTLKVKILKADVLSFNSSPQKMHKFFKYQDLGKCKSGIIRDGIELEVNKYQYLQENWSDNKESVYKKIPTKIVETINYVDFT